MKTKLLTLLLAGAFTIGLAACEQGGDPGDQFEQAPADQPAGDPGAPGGADGTGGTGGGTTN